MTTAKLRKIAETAKELGVTVEVKPDGTVKVTPQPGQTVDPYELVELK